MLINDIVLPLKPTIRESTLLNYSRLMTLAIGILSAYFALFVQNLFDLLLYTYKFWGPIVLAPLIAAFFHIQLKEKDFFKVCGSGGLTVLIWNLFDFESQLVINDLLAGLVVSSGTLLYIINPMVKPKPATDSLKIRKSEGSPKAVTR